MDCLLRKKEGADEFLVLAVSSDDLERPLVPSVTITK